MDNDIDTGKAMVFRALLKTLDLYEDGLTTEEVDDLKEEMQMQLAVIEANSILTI